MCRYLHLLDDHTLCRARFLTNQIFFFSFKGIIDSFPDSLALFSKPVIDLRHGVHDGLAWRRRRTGVS